MIKTYYPNSTQLKSIIYEKNNVPHREGGPAITEYYENGQVETIIYYKDGKRHRLGGLPALLSYYHTGQLRCKYFIVNGQAHHVSRPSTELYFPVLGPNDNNNKKIIILGG